MRVLRQNGLNEEEFSGQFIEGPNLHVIGVWTEGRVTVTPNYHKNGPTR